MHISKKVLTGQHYWKIRMTGHFCEVLHTNSHSMANKQEAFEVCVQLQAYDLFGITKTHHRVVG